MIHNRKTRRAADKCFADLIKEGWGDWEEIPRNAPRGFSPVDTFAPIRWHQAPTKPPEGLVKFVRNNIYSVQFVEQSTAWGVLTRLFIRRHDTKTTVSWAHKQRIKNELVGEEGTALEVFPPESKLFDEANIYPLWILPPDMKLPIVL